MKAIIPAAGLGTRFLPATRAIPKEMLPIGSVPALQLIVDEARRAGADGITIVVSPAKDAIRRYFEGQDDILFAVQTRQLGLGHAVLQARTDCDTLVLLGDAIVAGGDPSSEMAALSRAKGGCGVVGCQRVPDEMTSRYGIVVTDGDGRIADMVEKPPRGSSPGNLAIAGRYLLPKEIFAYLESQAEGVGGEIQLTDAIRRLAAARPVYACEYRGRRLDIGTPDGYYEALTAFRDMKGGRDV